MYKPIAIPSELVDAGVQSVESYIQEFCAEFNVARSSLRFDDGRTLFIVNDENNNVVGFFTCQPKEDASGPYLHAEYFAGSYGRPILEGMVNAMAEFAGINRWMVGPPRNVPYSDVCKHAGKEYSFELVPFGDSYPEMEKLYRAHYSEMRARLAGDGTPIGDYDPRLEEYDAASKRGDLLTFRVAFEGKAVGYANVYLSNDMHNKELIATEDAIFIVKEHRNGIGGKLVKAILYYLKNRGVKRVIVSPVTDLKVEKIWERMGFRTFSSLMVYNFAEGADSVRVKATNSHIAGRQDDDN